MHNFVIVPIINKHYVKMAEIMQLPVEISCLSLCIFPVQYILEPQSKGHNLLSQSTLAFQTQVQVSCFSL